MRTTVDIDESLLRKTMKLAKVRTKREAVNVALRELVATHERRRILEMFGADLIDPAYVRHLYGDEALGTNRTEPGESNRPRSKTRSRAKRRGSFD